tara:strand:- start:1063 stop:1227 length:165 start_codon:yes stop_codon:yes gene_type:complete
MKSMILKKEREQSLDSSFEKQLELIQQDKVAPREPSPGPKVENQVSNHKLLDFQ